MTTLPITRPAQPELQYQRTTAIETATIAPAVEIVKYQPPFDVDAHILAMYLLWASRPNKRDCEPDGSYFIGMIEEPIMQEQHLKRDTPYSVCKGIRR